MKELTIISGKGGTGKTSLAGSFVSLAKKSIISDCDVDAANLSLILNPELQEKHQFKASRKASIDQSKCSGCDLCRQLCRFGAITGEYEVNYLACEGCGLCFYACPEEAVYYEETVSGEWYLSVTPYGPLVHAQLGVAEENSGKLVTLLRQKAKELAAKTAEEQTEKKYNLNETTQKDNSSAGYYDGLIINDGPPGIGCPVIASLGGSSMALVVTEPTLSGIHDLERILSVCNHFNVPPLVCINRADLDEENAYRIEDYCKEQNIPFAGEIPFSRKFSEAAVNKMPLVEYTENSVSRCIKNVWNKITGNLFGNTK